MAIITLVEGEKRLPTEDEQSEVQRLVKEAQDSADQMKRHEDFSNYVKLVEGLADDSTLKGVQRGDGSDGAGTTPGLDAAGFKTLGELFAESEAVRGWKRQKGQVTTFEDARF